MVCLGLKHRAAMWKAQMNPLSYGGHLYLYVKLSLSLSFIKWAIHGLFFFYCCLFNN